MRQRTGKFGTAFAGVALLAVTAITLCGCGDGSADVAQDPATPTVGTTTASAVQEALQAGTAVNPQIVSADNTFGLMLFNALNENGSSNLAISPVSVALALQMLYNGAQGSTQQGMSAALQLQGLNALDVDQENAALQAALINPDPKIQLIIANSLWMHLASNPVLPAFTDVNQTYYAAQVGDLSGAPTNVNAWVSEETNGLITQILPPANYNDVVAVLANTVYFEAPWTSPFDVTRTSTAAFTLTDGMQVSCPMMHQTGGYPYFQGPNFQALQLPYGQNGRMSMLIILPAVGVDLDSFLSGLTAGDLSSWLPELQTVTGSISLPRFTSNYGMSLVNALSALGMGVAFDTGQANFGALAANTYVSDVEHKTLVQIDEAGTVAAAATTISVSPTFVILPSFSMTMDRPFFYAIVDNNTGVMLFLGALFDPTQ